MDASRWQLVEQLCHAALERAPGEQRAYLEAACAGDEALRLEVESLLAQQHNAAEFLEAPAMEAVAKKLAREGEGQEGTARERRLIGRTISHYRIVEKLATGGMGEVYRAVRADQEYEKQVAIKLVRSGLDTEFVLARFKTERQVLAGLEHPSIARLLDAGTTDDEIPFYVMELIEGHPIDEYCDSRRLPTLERLRLFRAVCSAVHYAHQRLVVHRDIKPANILVTAEGVPKLLDFGIAKILHSESLFEAGAPTVTMLRMMTPEYASPEQIRGEPITTASDVYSLGVVLYQMLTGRLPYRVSSHSPHVIAQAICETEAERPSTAVQRADVVQGPAGKTTGLTPETVSEARGVQPERLRRQLAGDLDHIVLKAIRKEPQDRYASAEQLSEDIERHLQGRPVIARARTWRYRSSKFIRRNTAGVAAAGLVVLALTIGMVTTIQQRRRAERRFNDVRALANSLLFEVHDSIKNLAGATPARKLLVSKALAYLDSLSQESAGDESLQRELATAYEKVGDVQGYPDAANLGDTAGALESYRKALAIRERLAARNGGSLDDQVSLAGDYERVGMALDELGDRRAALEFYRRDFARREGLAQTAPSAKTQDRLAGAYFLMGRCYGRMQDTTSALEYYRKSVAIREAIAAGSPLVQGYLAGTYSYMATILAFQGDVSQAVALQRKSLEILTQRSQADPQNATYRESDDEAFYWLGYFLEREGKPSQALFYYRRALKDFEALAAADPNEARTKQYVALSYQGIGNAQTARGDFAAGMQSIQKALSIFEALSSSKASEDLAVAYSALGLLYSRRAAQPGSSNTLRALNWKQSRAAYQKSWELWRDIRSQRELTFFNKDEPDRIKKELAKCDAALAKLNPAPS